MKRNLAKKNLISKKDLKTNIKTKLQSFSSNHNIYKFNQLYIWAVVVSALSLIQDRPKSLIILNFQIMMYFNFSNLRANVDFGFSKSLTLI